MASRNWSADPAAHRVTFTRWLEKRGHEIRDLSKTYPGGVQAPSASASVRGAELAGEDVRFLGGGSFPWLERMARLAAASIVASEAKAQFFPPLGVNLFHIYSLSSGQCVQPIEYDDFQTMLGLPTVQQPCRDFVSTTGGNIGDPGYLQAWFIWSERVANVPGLGNVHVFQFMNWGTGKCLGLRDGNTADGAYVQQWTCNMSNTEEWAVRSRNGYFELRNARSGKCLDLANASPVPGTLVWSYRCFNFSDGPNWAQTWNFY